MNITSIASDIAITPSIQAVNAVLASGEQLSPAVQQNASDNGGVNTFALSTFGSILQELETLLDNNPNDVNNATSFASSVGGVNAYINTSNLFSSSVSTGSVINAIA